MILQSIIPARGQDSGLVDIGSGACRSTGFRNYPPRLNLDPFSPDDHLPESDRKSRRSVLFATLVCRSKLAGYSTSSSATGQFSSCSGAARRVRDSRNGISGMPLVQVTQQTTRLRG
jgi:secreted trypsin-like serine protease